MGTNVDTLSHYDLEDILREIVRYNAYGDVVNFTSVYQKGPIRIIHDRRMSTDEPGTKVFLIHRKKWWIFSRKKLELVFHYSIFGRLHVFRRGKWIDRVLEIRDIQKAEKKAKEEEAFRDVDDSSLFGR